jgi:hypothetical protein
VRAGLRSFLSVHDDLQAGWPKPETAGPTDGTA